MQREIARLRASMLLSAAAATIGYSHYSFATTFFIYDANSQATAPDPTTDAGGDWMADIGGTQTQITAAAGSGADGNYWQITDPATNGSKGYIVTPPATDFQDPTGWTATEVVKVVQSSGPKQAPTATVGAYAAPSFLDIRGNGLITTVGQVNAGADEFFYRAQSGASSTSPLLDMDTHSYFNTYQMVFTPAQVDDQDTLIAPAMLQEYVNGHFLMDVNASTFNTSGVLRIQWFSGAQTSLQTIQYQLLKFETGNTVIPAPAPEVWNVDGGGELTLGTNWVSGNVPSGVNSTAHLGQTDTPATVTVSNPLSVGMLELNNTSGYTISGAGTLTLVNSERGAGAIDVDTGLQVISAPISPERSAIFTILDPTASLSLTGVVDTVGKDFRKAGPGAMDVANVRANSLKVSGGTLTIRADGTAAGVSKVTSLDISFNTTAAMVPIATMDLNDNPLIIDYTGTSPTSTLRSSLKGAFDNGAWDGAGLTSSVVKANAADSTNPVKTALGYAEASAIGVTMVGDQTLDSSSLLVRITLSGDSNLDGKVNALDFNALASTFGATGTKTWGQGDFNYDGTVNTSDFVLMSANFGQSITLSPGLALGSVVPEPVGFSVIASFALAWSLKRPRRARNNRAGFQFQSCT